MNANLNSLAMQIEVLGFIGDYCEKPNYGHTTRQPKCPNSRSIKQTNLGSPPPPQIQIIHVGTD